MAVEKKKRLEKRRAEPRHYFDDPSYMEQIRSTEESMDDALKQGVVNFSVSYVTVCGNEENLVACTSAIAHNIISRESSCIA